MKVEYISRISLSTRRTTEDKRHLAICHSLLGKVIIYHQCMPSGITEIFSDGSTCKRSIISQCCRIGCSGRNYYGIIQGTLLLEGVYDIGNCGSLLSYGHIYAIYRFTGLVCSALIDYRINGNGCLAGLSVTDYEFTLSPSDRNHGVYSLESCLERFGNRLTEYHTRSLPLKRHLHEFAGNLTFSVKRFSQRIDHSADHRLTYIHRCDPAGTLYSHTLLYLICRA